MSCSRVVVLGALFLLLTLVVRLSAPSAGSLAASPSSAGAAASTSSAGTAAQLGDPAASAGAAKLERAAAAAQLERAAARLERQWAPTFVQHVDSRDRGRDRPTRIDFDGDWDATNNWDNQARFGTALPPAAYGAAVLTETHAYLTYTLYYPRDWTRPFCVPYICHDNDLESVRLVVERDRDRPDGPGRLVLAQTKAHLWFVDVPGDEVDRDGAGRPLVWVEARGHGMRPCRPGDRACEARPGRLVYSLGDRPSAPPVRAAGQVVDYELLSLRETLWAHRRTDAAGGALWAGGETGPLWYDGERHGRMGEALGASMAVSRYRGGVRPPWALTGPDGERGDWFLDPAAVAAARDPDLFTDAASAPYAFHPFLADLRAECAGLQCARWRAPAEPSRRQAWAGFGAGAVLLALWMARVRGRLSRLARALRSDGRRRGR